MKSLRFIQFILMGILWFAITVGCSNHRITGVTNRTHLMAQEEYINKIRKDIKRYSLAKQDGIVGKVVDSIVSTMVFRDCDTLFILEDCNPPMYEYQYYAILLYRDKGWTIYWDGTVYNNYEPKNESEKGIMEIVREFDYTKILRYEHERPLAYYGSESRNRIMTRIIIANGKCVNVQSYIIMNEIQFYGETSPVIFD